MSEMDLTQNIRSNATESDSTPKDFGRFFYTGASLVLLVLSFIGFQLFYLHGNAYPGRPLTPPIRSVVIAHGVAMSLWILLLVIQPLLIVTKKHRVHILLGKMGAVLAATIFLLGVRVAIAAAQVNPPELKIWGLVPHQFLAIQVSAIFLFGGFVSVGVWKRRRSEIHRAMMLLGTLVASAAAIDRIGAITQLYAHTVGGAIFGPFFAPTVLGASFLLVKWVLTRSFDRAYALGWAVLLMVGPLIMKLAVSPFWASVTNGLFR